MIPERQQGVWLTVITFTLRLAGIIISGDPFHWYDQHQGTGSVHGESG